jgi:hypothetical protein
MMVSSVDLPVPASDWQERAAAHRARAMRFTRPAKERRDRALPHPIEDFLFEYYPFSFGFLEKWHPGIGVRLETGGRVPEEWSGRLYEHRDGVTEAAPWNLTTKELQRFAWMLELLEATQDRPPNFACHGLHEWAMVYRGKQVRHEKTLKLRLPQAEIDAVVEARPICCSHHDAFRFFADEARPMNHLQPDMDSRVLMEQPGCLHANMDLYKWTAKAMPWAGSDLLLDCFELAVALRDLDMRASPYDLTDWDREPVRIETTEGRRMYETMQRDLAARARPLRSRLIDAVRAAIALAQP